MTQLTYRVPQHNRKLFNVTDGSPVQDGLQMYSGLLTQEQISKLIDLSLNRSNELFEIQLSSNIIIRNIQKFYHFDDIKVNNPDVAELVIKNNNIAFLRHFFNKVLNNLQAFCLANLILDDLSFDNIKINKPVVVSSDGFDSDHNNDDARYFEKEVSND